MERVIDDDLIRFEADGAAPLPPAAAQTITHDGATIWYASYGSGPVVVLLHGGLGHSGNWGYQVPALVAGGYRAVVIDSRGHGRSTRDDRPYRYETMAGDVMAVLDALAIERAAFAGWSDGAVVALMIAGKWPERVSGVFYFACNIDPGGAKELSDFPPLLQRCFGRHQKDYAQLSATPDAFDAFADAVGEMQATQPNYTADDLARIRVPVTVVHSEHDEFIKQEHAEYLARTIPAADFVYLPGVSHFAPLQRPDTFNVVLLDFLARLPVHSPNQKPHE
jgi:pimeloyl-ACP methyl ester carboxylesterase